MMMMTKKKNKKIKWKRGRKRNGRTVVRICLKLTHCQRLNLSETLVTRSYGATFPQVSGTNRVQRSVAERVSERMSAAERVNEQMSAAERTSERTSGPHFPLRRFWPLPNHSALRPFLFVFPRRVSPC